MKIIPRIINILIIISLVVGPGAYGSENLSPASMFNSLSHEEINRIGELEAVLYMRLLEYRKSTEQSLVEEARKPADVGIRDITVSYGHNSAAGRDVVLIYRMGEVLKESFGLPDGYYIVPSSFNGETYYHFVRDTGGGYRIDTFTESEYASLDRYVLASLPELPFREESGRIRAKRKHEVEIDSVIRKKAKAGEIRTIGPDEEVMVSLRMFLQENALIDLKRDFDALVSEKQVYEITGDNSSFTFTGHASDRGIYVVTNGWDNLPVLFWELMKYKGAKQNDEERVRNIMVQWQHGVAVAGEDIKFIESTADNGRRDGPLSEYVSRAYWGTDYMHLKPAGYRSKGSSDGDKEAEKDARILALLLRAARVSNEKAAIEREMSDRKGGKKVPKRPDGIQTLVDRNREVKDTIYEYLVISKILREIARDGNGLFSNSFSGAHPWWWRNFSRIFLAGWTVDSSDLDKDLAGITGGRVNAEDLIAAGWIRPYTGKTYKVVPRGERPAYDDLAIDSERRNALEYYLMSTYEHYLRSRVIDIDGVNYNLDKYDGMLNDTAVPGNGILNRMLDGLDLKEMFRFVTGIWALAYRHKKFSPEMMDKLIDEKVFSPGMRQIPVQVMEKGLIDMKRGLLVTASELEKRAENAMAEVEREAASIEDQERRLRQDEERSDALIAEKADSEAIERIIRLEAEGGDVRGLLDEFTGDAAKSAYAFRGWVEEIFNAMRERVIRYNQLSKGKIEMEYGRGITQARNTAAGREPDTAGREEAERKWAEYRGQRFAEADAKMNEDLERLSEGQREVMDAADNIAAMINSSPSREADPGESGKGSPSEALRAISENSAIFSEVPFTLAEFRVYRTLSREEIRKRSGKKGSDVSDMPPVYSVTTVRKELEILRAAGLIDIAGKRGNAFLYAVTPAGAGLLRDKKTLEEVLRMPELQQYDICGTSEEDRKNNISVLRQKISPYLSFEAMPHPADLKDKTLIHVISADLIKDLREGIPTAFTARLERVLRRISTDGSVREKIEIVAKGELLSRVEELKSDTRNLVDAALTDDEMLDALPSGVKALIFKPDPSSDQIDLCGILGALRAVQNDDIDSLVEIYRILTGKAFSGMDALTSLDPSGPEYHKKFAHLIVFVLPPVRFNDYEEIRKMNERMLELLQAA